MNMTMDRRTALKGLISAGATALGMPRGAAAAMEEYPDVDFSTAGLGMLYDATLCIGCKVCMVACREANNLDYASDTELWDEPSDLSANAITIIKLYQDQDRNSFVKRQCMHCIDPACVSACPFSALLKSEQGVVTWDGAACVGCRYCEIGCPFNVPKFEWESRNPRIVKCQLCDHRLAEGGIPACVEECPRDAILFGTRRDLLAEAHRRVDSEPGRYHPHIYGENEAGGTQVLYLSKAGVPPESLGLPALDDAPLPEAVHKVQGLLYKGFVAPLALYAVVGTMISRNQKKEREELELAAQAAAAEESTTSEEARP